MERGESVGAGRPPYRGSSVDGDGYETFSGTPTEAVASDVSVCAVGYVLATSVLGTVDAVLESFEEVAPARFGNG